MSQSFAKDTFPALPLSGGIMGGDIDMDGNNLTTVGDIDADTLDVDTITGLAWATWTPTPTNFTIGTGGNAGITARYVQIGKLVVCQLSAVLGTSGQSVGGSVSFTLPVNARDLVTGTTRMPVGVAILGDAGVAAYGGKAVLGSATSVVFYRQEASGTNVVEQVLSSTTPFTWGAGDWITATFSYEAA